MHGPGGAMVVVVGGGNKRLELEFLYIIYAQILIVINLIHNNCLVWVS